MYMINYIYLFSLCIFYLPGFIPTGCTLFKVSTNVVESKADIALLTPI